jgi:hypothetical protein
MKLNYSAPYVTADITLTHYSIFKFTFFLNSALYFRKLVSKFLLSISET